MADGSTFEVVRMLLVLVFMTVCLVNEYVETDHVMVTALTLVTVAGLVTVEEAVAGFANQGVLTVMVMYVVASGITHTGGLDWYMSKFLGRPKLVGFAQLRLMLPVATASTFFNNTPLVAIMIPIVQLWGKKIGIPASQLLIPLSYASILGGTVTLIGTSTNLVVAGLLGERYPNEFAQEVTIGLMDLALYGVPVALVGFAYVTAFASLLLPNGNSSTDGGGDQSSAAAMLVKARVLRFSPACDRTVGDSGLRGLPGLYLVTVHKRATGETLRAVGPELVLQQGDMLEFTGVVESFGQVCEVFGLEPVTDENEHDDPSDDLLGTIKEEDDEDGAVHGTEEAKEESRVEDGARHGATDKATPTAMPLATSTPPGDLDLVAEESDIDRIRALKAMRGLVRSEHAKRERKGGASEPPEPPVAGEATAPLAALSA